MPRNFSSIASVKTLSSNVTSTATTISLNNLTGLPTPPYTLVLNPDTSLEEIVTVNSVASGTTLNVSRAQESTTAQAHSTGNSVRHMVTGRDLQEPQDHISASTAVHGLSAGVSVVGTSSTQTLTNKTVNLSSNTLTGTKAQFNTAMSDDDFATLTGTETLTNKTVRDSTFFISDDVDTTKKLQFQVSGLTTNTTRTLTVPDTSGTIVTVGEAGHFNPVGMLAPFAGSAAPTGWLLCQGQAVSRTTYSTLFGVIGTTYGTGDGSTTFNLPDLLGRVPIGSGTGSGLTLRNLGTKYGAETLPAHVHAIDHDHASFSTGNPPGTNEGSHTHTWSYYDATSNTGDGSNSGARWDNSSDTAESLYTITTAAGQGGHTHTVDVPAFTGNSGSTGTGDHGVIQPSLAMNYIIKF
jgi:microcystin-dependent protein